MRAYQTMTEIAAAELRKAIRKGDLTPGTRLIPSKLEDNMSLSRVSIREAIRELAGSGLVENVPNVGAHVASPPSLEELRAIYEARLVVEPMLAVEASKGINDEQMDALSELCKEMEKEPLPQRGYYYHNRRFHELLYAASGWKTLCLATSQFMDQALISRMFKTGSYLDFKATNREHRLLLKAVKKRDEDEITQLIKTQLASSLADLIKIWGN